VENVVSKRLMMSLVLVGISCLGNCVRTGFICYMLTACFTCWMECKVDLTACGGCITMGKEWDNGNYILPIEDILACFCCYAGLRSQGFESVDRCRIRCTGAIGKLELDIPGLPAWKALG